MKNTKKISVLISLVLITLLALGAVSAAEDTAVTDDASIATVDEIQTVDDAPVTDDNDYESNDIIVTDTGDSGDYEDAIDDVVSDSTGLQDNSDNGDEAVVTDVASPKNALKAETDPEPLRGPEDDPVGTFSDLWALIQNGGTVTLQQNYAYDSSVDDQFYSGGWKNYNNGLYITQATTINGNGHYISGSNDARIFDVNGATLTLNNLILKEGNSLHSTYTSGGWNVRNTYYGGAIYSHGTGATVNINNCVIIDNHATATNSQYSAGGFIYSTGSCTILNSIIANNSAYNGGAFSYTSAITIHGCVIIDNTATGTGDNGYRAQANIASNLGENWWGSNKGAEDSVMTNTANTYVSVNDYFILTETLTSVTTVEVEFVLYSGGTPTYTIPARFVTVKTDNALISTEGENCPGPFTIEFTTSEDAYINVTADYETQHLKVFAGENKKNITVLRVEVEDVTLPDQPIAYVYSDIDGLYNLTLGTQKFEVNVEEGVGTYQFSGLNVGQYTVIVSRVDDPVYKTTFNTTEFEVKRYATQLTIDTETPEPTYGNDVTITHALTPTGPTGFITYYVDGSETGTQLGVAEDFVLSGLTAGEHTVVAKYGGDGSYDVSTSNTLTINVQPAPFEFTVPTVTVNYPNKGTVNVNSNVDGEYSLTVNNVPYTVTVVNGKGSFEVQEVLEVGEYVIAWNIPAGNYEAASGTAVYNVTAPAPEFDITGSSSINYGQTNTITHTITEGATGTISYTLNGADAGTLGLDQSLVLENLDAGHYVVVAAYSGGGNYGPTQDTFEFDVLPIDVSVTVTSPEVLYPNTGSISLNASAPGTYTVKVGDKTYTAVVTTADVAVDVPVTDVLSVAAYDISVTADLGDNYNTVDTGKIGTYTVVKPATTLEIAVTDFTYGETASATITLKQGNTPLSGKDIAVTIDGTQQTVTTDANGEATVSLSSLNAGDHNIVAIFAGDENYALAYDIEKVTVNKATPTLTVTADAITYGGDATINIALDGVNSEKITGTVKVTIDSKDYDVAVTNGVGTLTVSGLAANEEGYAITVAFAGNDNYNGVSDDTKKQVVNKAAVTVTANNVTVIYPANGAIEITASAPGTYTVRVGTKDYTAVITTAGQTVSVPVTDVFDVGTYGISVTAEASENYAAVDTGVIANYTVTKGTITITADNVAVAYPEKGTFVITTDVAGTYTIKVGDETYERTLVAGENTFEVPDEFDVDVYDVKVSAVIDNYEAITDLPIATYTVNNGVITVTGQGNTVTYPNKGTITITTNVAGTYTIKVGDETYENVALVTGDNTFNVPDVFDAGTYDVKVSASIDNYEAITDLSIASYIVSQAQSTIDVSYEDGEFTITLDGVDGEKLSETVKVSIDGTAIDPIVTENGEYVLLYDSLTPGRHSILVTFDGNTNYLGDSKNYAFDVDKITPTLEVSIENTVYGKDAYIIASLYDGETPLNGVVEVTIVETETTYIVAVAEGSGILPVAGLDAGTYTYTAKSVADSTYASATQDERTFVVAPRTVLIEVDTFGGVDFGGEGEIEVRLYDALTDERIKDNVVLIFTDANGVEKARTTVETIVGPWERGDKLDFTADWPMGDYYVTVENPNYIFVKYDDSEYKFTSFGDEAGEIEYSTGTVEEIDNDLDIWIIKVKVLTNDADESYVGKEYYIDPDAYFDTERTYELMVYDGENLIGTGIWVLVHKDLIPDPAKYPYEVRKAGLDVEVVEGEGKYLYRDEHVIVLNLLKDDELFEINCPATIEVVVADWDDLEVVKTFNTQFENGAVRIDVSDVEPGSYMLKVSIDDDTYVVRMEIDDEDVDYCIIDSHDHERPLFEVMEDHLTLEEVTGVDNGRFRDERIFSFELWHHHWDDDIEEDVWELFKYSTTANVTVYSIVYDEELDEEVFNVVYNNENVAITNGCIGESIDFTYLPAGDYKITVSLIDPYYQLEGWDDNFGRDVDYAAFCFHIENDNLYANVDGTYWTEYGQDRIFKFDLMHWDEEAKENVLFVYDTNAIVKVYKLTWDDEGVEHPELLNTYPVAITGGHSAEIDLSDMNAGSYRVTIQLDDENGYEIDRWFNDTYGIQEERFDVGRSNVDPPFVEFDKEGYVYGDDVTVTVTITPQRTNEKLNEEIELNIMGKESIKKNLTDGVATFTLEDYEAGLYTIWVNFFGTDNYNGIGNHIDAFIIGKASPVIDVTPRKDEYAYGEDVIIDVTFKDGDNGLSGTAIVNVDGTDYVVNIEDGKGNVTISGLAANEDGYDIFASVAATDNYNGAGYEGDAKVVVVKSDDAKVDVKLEGDQIVVSLTGVDDVPLDGIVMVSIDGGDAVAVPITNGQGTLDASALTAGEHSVTATSVADDNYESATVTKTIKKASAPNDAQITVSVENIVYGQDAVVQVTFKDSEGNPLQDTLTVKIGEIEKTVVIGEDGTGSVSIADLTVGHYTAIVSFAGNETYKATSGEDLFDVNKLGTQFVGDDEIIAYATVGKTIKLTLKDANGNILSNRKVVVAFDGQVYNLTTDENGQIDVEINKANKGTYTMSASFAGEGNYESTFASFNVVVKAQATKLTVAASTFSLSSNKYVTATLTAGGQPLANKLVTFQLNGKTYTGRTNANGVVKVAVSLSAKKTYSVAVSYAGDSSYGSARATYKLKVTA